MRLILVDNLVFPVGRQHTDFDIHPNIGLASLAATANLAGHEVGIVDPKREVKEGRLSLGADLYRQAAEVLLGERPDVIGFTTLGCSFIFSIRVAQHLKVLEPALPILMGGPHATVLHREIMAAFDAVDVIVRHEAEDTVNPVLDALERRNFDGIPGVTYRTGRSALSIRATAGAPKVEDLDRLPFPAYELYPVERLDLPYLRVEAGRGCPWACTFCSTATFFQRSYRLKSPERLVRDLDTLHHRYGHTTFKLEHDLFTVNKRKVAAFCHAVQDRQYQWMASARIDCVDPPLLETMAQAGCRQLYFGIETGSEELQRSLHKRLDLSLVEPVLDAASQLGIEVVASFITGFPRETTADRDDTLRLIGHLAMRYEPSPSVQLHLLLPEPGTGEFAEHADEMRFDGHVAEFNAQPHQHDEALIRANPAVFATYHHYPGLIPRNEQVAVVELTRQLLALGPIVLRLLLDGLGVDLAELVAELQREEPDAFDVHRLERYVDRRLGRDHVVHSLVRLRTALGELSVPASPMVDDEPPIPDPRWPAATGQAPALVLSPRARLLHRLHDCGRVLDHVHGGRAQGQSTDLLADRHDYLAVGTDHGVRLFDIDPVTHLIASAFACPATPAAVEEALRQLLGRPVAIADIVHRLVRGEALVPAAAEAAPARVDG